MIISILLSILVFSLVVLSKGLSGADFDILSIVGYSIAYSIPIFIIEMIVEKMQTKNKWLIFLQNLWIALFSTILWGVAFGYLYNSKSCELEGYGWNVLAAPLVYAIFLGVDIFLTGTIILIKNKILPLRAVFIFVLFISFILIVVGSVFLAKCEGKGCANPGYRAVLAQRNNNPSICENPNMWSDFWALFLPYHLYCEEECYTDLAIKMKNVEICNLLVYKKNNCRVSFANNYSDTSVCDKLTEDYTKGDCYSSMAVETNNIALCEISGNAQNDCYFESALKLKDAALCENIDFEKGKNNCLINIESIQGKRLPIYVPMDANY